MTGHKQDYRLGDRGLGLGDIRLGARVKARGYQAGG